MLQHAKIPQTCSYHVCLLINLRKKIQYQFFLLSGDHGEKNISVIFCGCFLWIKPSHIYNKTANQNI